MSAKIKKINVGLSENMDLKTSAEKFEFMFERSSGAKSFTLPSGEINVNPAFGEMLGYSQEELNHKSWQEITYPDDLETTQKALDKILAGQQDAVRFEKRYLHKSGAVVWGEVSTILLRNPADKPLYFMTEINDITARKQAEEALRESEERYKLMFESAPLAINITRGTEITYANPSYLKLFGFSNLDELKNIPPLELFTPEARGQILENIQRRTQGLPVPNSYEAECFRKDRTRFTVLMHLTRITFADGPATVAFIIDITERKQTEEALRESESTARALLDLPLTASFLINAQGTILDLNETMALRFGQTAAEIKGCDVYHLLPPEIASRRKAIVEEVIASGQMQRYEDERQGIWNDHMVNPILDEQGKVVKIVIAAHDISEHKRIEEALREKEALLSNAFNNSPLLMTISDLSTGKYLEVNDSFCKISGFSKDEAIGRTAMELGWISAEEWARMMNEVHLHGTVADLQLDLQSKNGEAVICKYFGIIIQTAQGNKLFSIAENITERKQAEAALHKSEAKFRAIVENSNDGILFGDAQANILYRSPSYDQINGYTEAERVGHNGFETVHPDDAAGLRCYWAKVIEHPEISPRTEYRIQHKDGSWRWIETRCRNLLHKPEVQAVVVTSRDITEQKRAEEQLRKSEKDYRTLVENIQMGLVVHAPDTSILYSNPRASELLGLTPDQMRGKAVIDPAWHFIQKDGSRMPLDQYPVNQALAAEAPITNLILGILRPDRENPTWVQCNAHQDMDLDGKLQQVVVTFVDITELKRAEAALRENELKYRSLFETASDAILLFTDGQWVDCNAGALKIFGCTREQIIGTHPNRFSPPTQPDGRSSEVEANQKIKLAFAGKPQSFEWEHCHADGTLFAAEVHLNRLDLEGKPYIQAIVRDVTERKQAEAALRESELTSRRMSQQLAVVHQMSAEIASGLDFEQLIERLYQQCQRIGDTDSFYLAFYDDETNMLSFPIFFKDGERRSIESRQLGNNSGLSGQIIKNRQVIYIPDTFDLPPEVTIVRQPGIPTRSIIGVPLFLNERIVGVLSMQSHKTDAYRADQVFMLELLSKQVVVAIHNSRLYQQAQHEITARKQAEKEIALRLSFEMLLAKIQADFLAVTADEVDQAILSAQRKLCEFFGTDRSALWQGSADEPEKLLLTHLCALDEIPPVPENVTTNTLFPWFTRQLLANQIVAISDLELLPPEAATDFENLTYYGDKSTLAIPFSFGDLPICGALSFAATAQPAHWSAATLAHCGLVAQVFSGVLARKKVEDEVRKLNAELEARVEERTLELRKAQEQLIQQERLSVLGRLASGVAHELRNPLGVISNAVYFLKLILPDANEKVREYLNILADESQTASKFAADLLNYSNIQSGDRYPVAVLELVNLTLTHRPAPMGVIVQLDIPADLPPAYVDSRQIVQVLDNLVLNAYQAMLSPTGMISDGKLTISAREINNMLAIAIRDTGEGIQPENITRIFEPLFSSKPRGIGLGLPISQKLAEVNGGKIEVESQAGKGSTFIVNLPIKTEEQA